MDAVSYRLADAVFRGYDDRRFSLHKQLWPYQREALEGAAELLLRYYFDWQQQDTESLKQRLSNWYRVQKELDTGKYTERFSEAQTKQHRQIRDLYREFRLLDEADDLPFINVCNRMSFWMATGSGKTLVIVKLVELLAELMSDGAIPQNDILVLSHRDDLLEQIRQHVDEYNSAWPSRRIVLEDLRRYPDYKRQQSLLRDHEIVVFIYNADNLTMEHKEKEVDFRNYENNGHWYIILDEAHRGKHSDSVRKAIFNIMSRSGFLFNFSATISDPIDRATVVYNLNLSEFINQGYAKHIAVLQEDTSGFSKKDDEDYDDARKQLIVLKSLLLLTYIKRVRRSLPEELPYHSPLLVVFTNSVNVEGSDLELFFRELERVGRGDVSTTVLDQAKQELAQSLGNLVREFEGVSAVSQFDRQAVLSLTLQDILECVYNATDAGSTEVILSPLSDQEIAFKLKTGDRPYALIRIGNIQPWLKEKLTNVEISESIADATFFQSLNRDDSPINVLLGSRTFYEGWDSNRPNIALYVNIGKGKDAQKFVLQSVGRGVRISPCLGLRGRLSRLARDDQERVLSLLSQHSSLPRTVEPIETLFVFAASKSAMDQIVNAIDTVSPHRQWQSLDVVRNDTSIGDRPLLIPVYNQTAKLLVDSDIVRKFQIAKQDLELLRAYVQFISDDRILWAAHGYQPREIRLLRRVLSEPSEYFVQDGVPVTWNVDRILARLKRHFSLYVMELERIKSVDDEIRHYLHIQVSVDRADSLRPKFDKVKRYPEEDASPDRRRLRPDPDITVDDVRILYLEEHYYYPVLVAQKEKLNYLKHIISTNSERQFIEDLMDYISTAEQPFNCDWWMFSKLDEHLDRVYIPYYDRAAGEMREYHPDFIFWFQSGDDYTVVFVDPKGPAHADYQYKVDGYRFLFEENGQPKVFDYNGYRVRFLLKLYTKDRNAIAEGYRGYWIDVTSDII